MPTFPLLLLLLMCLPVVAASLGNCDGSGQNCDWTGYWLSLWKNGIWAFVIAAFVFAFFLVYCILKVCCCCCIALFKCCCKCATSCCKSRRLSNVVTWVVRALLLVTFALGLAGFCLAAVGWGKANAAVLNVQSAYTQYATVQLYAQSASMSATLSTANSNMTTVGLLTGQSNLIGVLNATELASANTSQQGVVSAWQQFQSDWYNPVRAGWNALFWVATVAPMAVLLGAAIAGLLLRCGAVLPTLLSLCGLLSATLLWATVGVAWTGGAAVEDICREAALIPANVSRGWGLLDKCQCTQPASANQFAATAAAYAKATPKAAEGGCASVRGQCSSGSMSCPAIPNTCTSYSDVGYLPTNITVNTAASNGGCDNQCTAQQCASTCTGATLHNASEGLVISALTTYALTNSQTTVLNPVVSCQYITNTFIAQLNIQCPDLKQGANEVKSGMVTLAIGSLVGVGITVLLSHWFKPTKHGKGGEEDADSEAHEVKAVDNAAELKREAAYQSGIDARPLEPELGDDAVYPTPVHTPHSP
eukprot:EG_transcript_4898